MASAKKDKIGIEVVTEFIVPARYGADGELVEPVHYKPGIYPNPDELLQRLANTHSAWVKDHRTTQAKQDSIMLVGPRPKWGQGYNV